MAKVAKLILAYPSTEIGPDQTRTGLYRVVRSQHTTEFNPGDYLTRAQVDELNASRHWDVSCVNADR